jgi:AP-4 complex subunit mu-1
MWISQIFILSSRGDKLVFKDYRQDVPRNSDEAFFRKFKFWDGTNHQAPLGDCPPFFTEKGILFAFVRRHGMLFVATSRHNASPSYLGEVLSRTVKIMKDFLGVMSEESIRKNFVMCYEILDEVVDSGAVQELNSERLRPYIFNEPIKVEDTISATAQQGSDSFFSRIKRGEFIERTKKAGAAQQSIVTGSKERKNEIYIDIIERLNCVFDANGTVIASEVDGSITMKSFLAGTPDLFLGLNEDLVVGRADSRSRYSTVCLDSVNFYEALDYSRFESERTLMMRPPDGEFTVMNYRLTGDTFTQPFRVIPSIIMESTYKAELTVRIRADIPSTTAGIQVAVRVPVPKVTTSIGVEFGIGATGQTYEYKQGEKYVIWYIQKFAGNTEQMCKIRISTGAPFSPTVRKEIGPISMNFEVPMHNVSGLGIKFLRIEERSQSYNPQRWVRNITQANSYVTRVH